MIVRNEKKFINSICVCALAISCVADAHNKMVVIPMSGDDLQPLKNIVTVAKANGDFDSPTAALNSINDASAANPYLVVIAPGVYTLSQQLVMKEYVEIAGSGQNATQLEGSIGGATSAAAALIVGANHSSLRDISLTNMGAVGRGVGIYNDAASPVLSHLAITVSGATGSQYGIANYASSAPAIRHSEISVKSGSSIQRGIYNHSSHPTISDVVISTTDGSSSAQYGIYNTSNSAPSLINLSLLVSGSGLSQYGVYNYSSEVDISNARIVMSGGSYQYGVRNYNSHLDIIFSDISTVGSSADQTGIFNLGSSTSTVSNVKINASGGGGNQIGIYNASDASASVIRNSSISAPTNSIAASTGSAATETYISDSILDGGPVSGDPRCSFTRMADGTRLDSLCSLPP